MSKIFTNCIACNSLIITQGYEIFKCEGCGINLIPFRYGNYHRTRKALSEEIEYKINEKKKYSSEILFKRIDTREKSDPIDIPNHSNHFTTN